MPEDKAGDSEPHPAPPILDRSQARILWVGIALVSLAVLGTRIAVTPTAVRFFDNLHWTTGYAVGALLAWSGWRRHRRPLQRWFVAATCAYLVGQLTWDVQVLVDWNPFPGPSDLFYSMLGLGTALGLTLELRGLPRPGFWAGVLDCCGIAAAAFAFTLVLYLPRRGTYDLLETATLIEYPVLLSTGFGAGVVVLLARRLRLTPAFGLLLGAMATNAVIWGEWNLKTLDDTLGDGVFLNYVFSYSAIALGLGAALWNPIEVRSPGVERVYFVLANLLPLVLAVGAGVALQQSPSLPASVAPWVRYCSLLIIVSAAVRQSLALAERELRLAAERRARVLADQYHAAVASQEQAHRLESLGTLAAGVAHDFNNLLMSIRGHIDLASLNPRRTPEAVEAIRNACDRGAEVVKSLLVFGRSRPSTEPHRRLSLPDSIHETLRLVRAAIPASVTFETALDVATPRILAGPSQIQQILMNLASNAADALGNRPGTVRITTRPRELPAANAFSLPPGRWAEWVVSDNGPGMDESTRERIFEPFFSTKAPDRGTGMGLAVVHGIVTGAGGFVGCESAPGRGTRFTILWPAAPEAPEEPAAPPAAAVVLPADIEVLVVDDEPDITRAVLGLLAKLNLRGRATNDPFEAIEILRAEPRRFAAVVCDLTMPEMRGDGLCQAVAEIAPGLPVILSSGTDTYHLAEGTPFAATLVKPYDHTDLAAALARALDPGFRARDDERRPR